MTKTTLIDRALIRLSGDDVRGFLQGLVTNDVAGDLPVWAGMLTPQGKALFDFIVWADGDDLLIDCEEDAAAELAKKLTMYRLRRPVIIAIDETLSVHWAAEGDEGDADPRAGALGRRWVTAASEPAEGYHAHRLSVGIVEGRAELGSDKSLWLECNAVAQNGVSFTKGCYTGQENTARMNYRGKVNRRLTVVMADSDPGDAARVWYPDFRFAIIVERIVG